jgi:uncharacterized protein YbaR (Trm112 family)
VAATEDAKFAEVKGCRYCEKSQELVNDSLGVAYPIIDGVACLVPSRGRLVEKLPEDPEPDPAAGR